MDTQERIAKLVKENQVVLFMKGNRGAPRCGFSARVVDILDELLPEYRTVDVLSDPEIRDGVKAFSAWPTIPQLYVRGDFVGGCDIVTEMQKTGELAKLLGAETSEPAVPKVRLTDGALAALRDFNEAGGKPIVRVEISRDFEHGMDFDEQRDGDIVVDTAEYRLLFDRTSARRADGMTVDYVEGSGGGGFKIDNPNEPPRVQQLAVTELAKWMSGGKPMEVFDVRTADERAMAKIEGTTLLDEAGKKKLEALDRDVVVVFHCHHGGRSQMAAQHALGMGFRHVYNVKGGIDAWSEDVDAKVPKY